MLKIENNEDYNSNNYWYKHLLKNIKDLDKEITEYLMEDIYSRNTACEENVIGEIEVINDITNFILNREKEKQEDNYHNYSEGDCEKRYEYIKNIHNSWYYLELIKDKILEIIQPTYITNLSIKFNKGFDTGIGLTNFATIDIYSTYKKDNCRYHEYIIGVSTTNGKNFRVHVSNEFVKKVNPDLEGDASVYNKRLEYEKAFEEIDNVVEYVIELIKQKIKVGE